MEHDTAGDPITGLKWTRKTTEKIACELKRQGILVCANTVGKLLKNLNFSLKVNHKKNEMNSKLDPRDRDQQFKYIAKTREYFMKNNHSVISVDGKKKELIGNFKNAGAIYCREAENVNVYDYPSDAKGKSNPYGIYDIHANTGTVFVGTSYDTPSFAVESIASWWDMVGSANSSNYSKVLILADGGGSNSSRSRVWKYELQEKICNKYEIDITVCHYPPGCSKWNPIEHRLFSAISDNWRGVPLRDYEVMLNHIKTTKNSKGLKVDAHLVTKHYEKGKKISDKQMASLKIKRHEIFPNWNYTLLA
jgi:hypothetical protein